MEEVVQSVMLEVIVGEGHQDHKEDGHHRKDQDTGQREGQQGAVEVVVHQGVEVVPAALEGLAASQDFLGNLVLLDVGPPGVDKGHNKEEGQDAVKQDFEGVVAVNGFRHFNHAEAALLLHHLGVSFHGAQAGQLAQPIAAGGDHIENEYDLK